MSARRAAASAHWRVYPLGVVGKVAVASLPMVVAFLIGTGASLLLLLLVGLLGDEVLTYATGGDELDMLSRAMALPMLVLSLGSGMVAAVLHGLIKVLTSRALITAARAGASTDAVPHPSQFELTSGSPFFLAQFIAGCIAGVLALTTLVGFFTMNRSELPLVFILLALTVTFGLATVAAQLPRAPHKRRAQEIARHWPNRVRNAALQRAAGDDDSGSAAELAPVNAVRARRLERVSGVCLALGFIVMQLWLVVTHPNRGLNDAGPRAEYSDDVEQVLVGFAVLFGLLLLVGMTAGIAALIKNAGVDRAEVAVLRAALADPSQPRPGTELLRKFSTHQPVKAAQALALVAAIMATLGGALYLLGTGALGATASLYSGAEAVFGRYVLHGSLLLVLSAASLVTAVVWDLASTSRRAELQNLILATWPVKPKHAGEGASGRRLTRRSDE